MMFLIDANLPKYISIWNSDDYLHVADFDESLSDTEVWNLAKEKNLIIVTKDSDFYFRILLNEPPPKVIYLRLGNMRINKLVSFLNANWDTIIKAISNAKMVTVFKSRIQSHS